MKLYIAGDSTAATKEPQARPEAGWGEYLQEFMPTGIEVENHAINGRSTKSFLFEERLAAIEAKLEPGDALLIQFGHNDGKVDDPYRYTDLETYQENLGIFIETARKRGAQAVLLTSVSRRTFENGVLQEDTVGPYPAAMREVARKKGVPLLDLYYSTWKWLASLGDEESKQFFITTDNTHFNETGAQAVAAMVASTLEPLFTGEV